MHENIPRRLNSLARGEISASNVVGPKMDRSDHGRNLREWAEIQRARLWTNTEIWSLQVRVDAC